MILKGSQRGGAKRLGLHLLKTEENEHVEVHDIRGFMAEDVVGALREAEAISKGTKCRQYLFSVSLNPPEKESVRIDTFEKALEAIEEKHGLADQPGVIVFHEKEGRRHCHADWSISRTVIHETSLLPSGSKQNGSDAMQVRSRG